jgi:hypothetical protein
MFYLKEFFKTLGEMPIRGASFFLFSCLFALGLTHRPWISSTIEKISPEKMVNPYFVAVLDGTVDDQKIKEVLKSLPGIVGIDDKESDRSRMRLQALVGELGNEYVLQQGLMDFKSLRVVLSPSLSLDSLDFIRDQVVKMGGKEHVTATGIKYPEVTAVMKAHPFYGFLSKMGDWGVIAVLAIFWVVSYFLCYDMFRSRSYIIEKFQRRRQVAAKSIATGLGVVFFLFNIFGVWNGTLKFFDSILLFMVFSVLWSFSMQEWRWKPNL